MGVYSDLFALILMVLAVVGLARASDQDPLQDFCVADLTQGVLVNGYPCKDPRAVTAADFAFSGLAESANLSGNPFDADAITGFVQD
ncbi:hypothetical protein Mapa_007560 [Marchantia paleacea]|nr:hypothetical protein Mapa_007560 [Marchantia paleacea]